MQLEERIRTLLERLPPRPFWEQPLTTPDFTSNDYLGLVREGIWQEILAQCPLQWWRGSTASRYLGGDAEPFHTLEAEAERLWAFPGEKALLFPSGLAANLSFWSIVPQRSDTVLFDREVHVSIRQGIRLSGATAWGFAHNDFSAAEALLRKARGEAFLVVESLYSMRGTAPDPSALHYLVQRYGCHLVVDEAHTTFILPQGKSWSAMRGLTPLARLFTLGKAIGGVGALWIGPEWLIAYLRQRGFGGIYTTALPPLMAWGAAAVLRRSPEWEARRKRLEQLIQHTKVLLAKKGWAYEGLAGPIALIPAEGRALPLKRLYPPTVAFPAYRVSLHAHNTEAEVEELFR